MSEADLLAALTRHVAASANADVLVEQHDVTALEGGYVSKAINRIDLTLVTLAGIRLSASFVRKACLASEVQAIRALATVVDATALPDIIEFWSSAERPYDPEANGFVTPFYPGGPLIFSDPIPEAAIITLARVHAKLCQEQSLGWTWTFNGDHLQREHARVCTALRNSKRFHDGTVDPTGWLQRLERAGR